jgi:hypothetical protein
VARRTHGDGDGLAADPELEWLLDRDDVLFVATAWKPPHGRADGAVVSGPGGLLSHLAASVLTTPARWHDPGISAMRFPIRFTGLNRAMALLGLTPGACWVEIGAGLLRVRMSWAFHLDVALESVRDARVDDRRVWSTGVHGWRGRWLVNGSSTGLVRIDLDPQGRGRMLGIPVSVRELAVSVDDPRRVVAELPTRP